MTDFPNLNMSIGEYYKMLMDGKRPTRQRTHDPPQPNSTKPRSGLQTLKLKKPEKKEEAKDSKSHQPTHGHHKDPDERKREEKLMNKIKAKENQKDIKSIKEHAKHESHEKIQPKGDSHHKEKLKSKLDPPAPSEQPKLRHHQEALAPKKEHKESELRQKQIQPQQLQNEENELFESVFPHPKFSEGRLCAFQNDEGHQIVGKIISFDDESQEYTIEEINNSKRIHKIIVPQISKDSANQNNIQMLSKPFFCRISHLSVSSNPQFYKAISAYFSSSTVLVTPSQLNKIATSKFFLPIIQVINTHQPASHEEAKSDINSKPPHYNPSFKAVVPLRANKTNDEEDEEMKDEEHDNVELDDGMNYQLIDITFKDGFNPNKDLKPFDSDKLQEENNRAQFLSPMPASNFTISAGKQFFHSLDLLCVASFNAYREYVNKSSSVILIKENMHDLLFSLCRYETFNKEQQLEITTSLDHQNIQKQTAKQRQGVLLRIKYDHHYQDYLLMFRVTLSKQFQKERIEWIQLSKTRIRSDLTKGYVSIEYLQNLENIATTNQKIKIKNLQFVSYFQIQQAKNDLKDPILSDHLPMDSLENKATSIRSLKARCDCCNYTTEDIPSLQCSNCNKVYHEQCLQSEHLSLLSVREKKWRCSDCIRCTNCLSIKNNNLMMICTKCNSPFHYDCLDQSVKLSVPFIGLQEKEPALLVAQTSLQAPPIASNAQALPNVLTISQNKSLSPTKVVAPPLTENHYKCENCIYCEHCGVREAGKNRLNKWSKDFKLCSKCNKKKKNKQYCPICEMFWPNQEKEQKRENWNLNQTQQKQLQQDESVKADKPSQQEQMMYCVQCQMWIHNECDRMLQSDQVREKFTNSNNTNEIALQNSNPYASSFPQKGTGSNALEYNCPDCRQSKRTQLVVQLVENICGEDKSYFFQEPVEDRVKGYTKIVKIPMCFRYIKQQIHKLYLRNPEQLQADIALIFTNAKLFNLPKHKVHKDAIKLDIVSQQLIQSIWPTLQKYKNRTLDEDLHKSYIKICTDEQKLLRQKRLVGEDEEAKVEIEMDESKFNFKAQDLFDINEHQSAQNNKLVYQNSNVGQFGMNEIMFEEHRDGSESQGDDDSMDVGDTFFAQKNSGGVDANNATSDNAPGVVKNLRTRKQINYNEDRFAHASSDMSLLSKRKYKAQASLNIGQGEDESTFSMPQGQVGRPPKRPKNNQDPDFVPSQYLSSLKSQGSDLLQQAIQQQQKQQQQQNQQEQSSLALTGQDSFIANNKQMESSQNQHIQQQQQMMMNYYQEIDDEKCYYSNPSRCSFDDPSLLFEEMCYLCGSFGNREDFLSCTLCGESFHTYCLSLPHDDISKFQSYWKCLNCKFCEICSSAVQENLLLYCDVCDKAFHSYCLKPKLEVIPNCGWKCQECFNCVKCNAKSFFNSDDVEQQKNKEVKDFKFSNNFSFCYQCGSNEYKKSFCSICKEKDENAQEEEFNTKIMTKRQKMQQQQQLLASEANAAKNNSESKLLSKVNGKAGNNRDLMMKCSVCQYYSHLRCSRVTQDMIEELEQEALEGGEQKKSCYKCLNCLLSGKTINHLIRESCEHYENIHQIISRQKLLAQICAEVLNKYIPIQEKAPLFIKNFVDQNQDFFKSNRTINEWLLLLETNVCFESDESQFEQTKDRSQPREDHDMAIEGEDCEENKQTDERQQQKKDLWERIALRGINNLEQEVDSYQKGLLDNEQVEMLFMSLKDIISFDAQKIDEGMKVDNQQSEERFDDSQSMGKLIQWFHDNKKTITGTTAIPQIISPQTPTQINTNRVKQITYRKWDDVTFNDITTSTKQQPQFIGYEEAKDPTDLVIQQQRETIAKSKQDIVEHELFAHKQTFLPPKRNLYKSLFYGDLYRQSQRDHFMDPTDLKNLITIPNEENLELYGGIQARAEDYVKLEFKAIIQIRMQFFKWSEELIKSIVKNNQKFMRKERRKLGLKVGKGSQQQMQDNNSMKNEESHMTFDNADIIDTSQNKSQVTMMNQIELLCNKTDDQIKNPQMKLTCILCKLSGELKVTGRLIPYQVNQFVHINCALWSTDVFETEDGQLVNFYFVHLQRAKSSKCQVCSDYGATVYCFSRKCHNSYHFPCAYRQNKVAFLKNKETYCESCCRQKDIQAGYLEEYSTQRRLYIVKNIQPYLTTAFSIQPVGQVGNNAQSAAQQQQNLAASSTVGAIVGAQEGDKPFQIEKWRPFYYDMFNRVGNLTVLSLKKEINQIIEDIKSSFGPMSSSLQIESSQMNDFATIRIYWKFYSDQQMQIEDPAAMNPISLTKGFFLYSNNQVREIAKNEFYTVLQHVSERVKDKVQWAINMSGGGIYQTDSFGRNEGNSGINGGVSVIHNQTNFWSKILTHFQKERPNFSLQNIEFSIQEFAGKTKYPISIWNRAEVKNKNFFLKSGLQQLAALCQDNKDTTFLITQGSKASRQGGLTQDDIFKNMLKINHVGGVDNQSILNGGNQYKRYISSKHMKYDQILQQLGKKVLFFKAPSDEQSLKQQKEKDQLQKRLNKKLRITDTIDVVNKLISMRIILQNKQIDLPIAMKYRMCKAQPKRVEVGPSKIHRNGLFTLEDLMAGDIVIEYVGEKIRNKVADKREVVYEQKGVGDCYLFRLDKETIIDATFFGNKARYLNHCCDANCSAKIINVQGLKHIIISANRAIKSGEELTYNYNFDIEAEKLECYCGVANCVGRLN